MLKTGLVISLLLNLFLALLLVNRMTAHPKETQIAQPFSVTNLNTSSSATGYVVAFQEGKYWGTIDADVLSLNVGPHQGVTLRLDKDTGRVKSTTTELYGADDQHCYFTDFNADGVPDKKRVGSDENWQIFYAGEFVPSFAQGTNRYIVKDGTNLLLKFDGGRWKAVE